MYKRKATFICVTQEKGWCAIILGDLRSVCKAGFQKFQICKCETFLTLISKTKLILGNIHQNGMHFYSKQPSSIKNTLVSLWRWLACFYFFSKCNVQTLSGLEKTNVDDQYFHGYKQNLIYQKQTIDFAKDVGCNAMLGLIHILYRNLDGDF